MPLQGLQVVRFSVGFIRAQCRYYTHQPGHLRMGERVAHCSFVSRTVIFDTFPRLSEYLKALAQAGGLSGLRQRLPLTPSRPDGTALGLLCYRLLDSHQEHTPTPLQRSQVAGTGRKLLGAMPATSASPLDLG